VGAAAVPGLLPSEEASSSSEEGATRISSTRFDDAHWQGRARNGGAWVYAKGAWDLANYWGIDGGEISRLAGNTECKPAAHLAAKYEVKRLKDYDREGHLRDLNKAACDAAFHARLDTV